MYILHNFVFRKYINNNFKITQKNGVTMQKSTKIMVKSPSNIEFSISLPADYRTHQPQKGVETLALYGYLISQALRRIKELNFPNQEKLDELAYLCETYFDFTNQEINQNEDISGYFEDEDEFDFYN